MELQAAAYATKITDSNEATCRGCSMGIECETPRRNLEERQCEDVDEWERLKFW